MEYLNSNGGVILALTLVVGWLLGLLSRSGGTKWKSAYNRERDAHVALRKEYEALLKQRIVMQTADRHPIDPVRTGAF